MQVTVDYGEFSKSYGYGYDAYGRKISYTDPAGVAYGYTYDIHGRLSRVEIPGEGVLSYQGYEANGLPGSVGLPGGSMKEFGYDPLQGMTTNRLLDAAQNAVMDRNYQRNKTGNITGSETEHGTYVYDYDAIDQLTGVTNPVLGSEAYSYDAVGNRLSSLEGAAPSAPRYYEANNLNQYLSITSACPEPAEGCASVVSLSYDLNGNTTQKLENGIAHIYRWDIENRLIGYSNSESGVSAEYAYDPFGRRIRKIVNSSTNHYLYADEGLVAELDSTGGITRAYGYTPNSLWMNNPLFMRVASNYYYFLTDHLGAPQKLMARNGQVVWEAYFESFGKAVVSSNSTVINNLRFSSQYFDEESGLHYNTHRYYEPEVGRYLTRDPMEELGFILTSNQAKLPQKPKWELVVALYSKLQRLAPAALAARLNLRTHTPHLDLYIFVWNNPLSVIDPVGLYGNPISGPGGPVGPSVPSYSCPWRDPCPGPAGGIAADQDDICSFPLDPIVPVGPVLAWIERGTKGVTTCCKAHDDCYKANGCNWHSWRPGCGSPACKQCNGVVAGCVMDVLFPLPFGITW